MPRDTILLFDQERTFQLDGTAMFCATTQHEKQRIAHITARNAVWPMAVVWGERSSGKGDEDGATTCQGVVVTQIFARPRP